MEPGKIDRAFFESSVYPHLGADRGDVLLGPAHGVDFGAVSVGDRAVAMATDPVWVLPDLPTEAAAWYAFHVVVSDAAMSGLDLAHLAVDLNLPPETERATFEALWETFDREAGDLGMAVVTGHTAAYEGCSFPVLGGATATAVGDPAEMVRPDGATPGDRVVVTKGPAVEATGLLAELFGDRLDLDEATVAAARERFPEISPVADARAAADTGRVTAMHDATERGLSNALHELAGAAGVRLAVERERVPVGEGVREVCAAFDVDPWHASSEGTVVLTVEPGGIDDVLAALAEAGVRAAEVGRVAEGEGVTLDGAPLAVPERDPLWEAYQRGRAMDEP